MKIPAQGTIRATRGFTLVELLVVIGIIAILMAVSMTGIMSAIEASRSAICTSNLHQIGMGFNLYTSDNNNTLPQRYYPNSAGNIGYESLLMPYVGTNGKVFECPDLRPTGFPSEPSYGMNWYYDNVNLATITQGASLILATDTTGSDGTGSRRADRNSIDPGQLAKTRHRNKANYLFFDGHVEKLSYQDTLTPLDMWGYDHGMHDGTPPISAPTTSSGNAGE